MKKKTLSVGTVPKSNRKIVERTKSINSTQKYKTVHFPGLIHALE